MAFRPTKLARWASVPTTNGITGLNNVLEPNTAKKNLGWDYDEFALRNYQNWIDFTNYSWMNYLQEHLDQFAVIEQAIPDMTVQVTAGVLRSNTNVNTNVAIQSTGTITAPSADPRIDLIALDEDGVVQVITGVENASPVVPDIVNSEYIPLATILFATTTTTISNDSVVSATNANIDPIRVNQFNAASRNGDVLTGNYGIGNVGAFTTTNFPSRVLSAVNLGGTLLHVKDSVSSARVVLEGATGVVFDLVDSGGGADTKWMQLLVDAGITKFASITDAGSLNQNNIIVMDHATGNVGFGISPITTMHTHRSGSGSVLHKFTNDTTGTTGTDGFSVGIDSAENGYLWNYDNTSVRIATNNLERIVIANTGLITAIAPIANIITRTGQTTGASYDSWVTTGGSYYLGSDSSAGGVVLAGSTAYAFVMNAVGSRPIQFGTNDTLAGTIDTSQNFAFGPHSAVERMHAHIATSAAILQKFTNSTTGATATDGLSVGLNSSEQAILWNYENTLAIIATNNLARLNIAADGGIYTQGVAGGSKGVGSGNFGSLYINNVLVTSPADDFVSGSFTTGSIASSGSLEVNVAHGYGSDDIQLILQTVGSVDGNIDIRGRTFNKGYTESRANITITAPIANNFKVKLVNQSGSGQTVTVYWTVRKR